MAPLFTLSGGVFSKLSYFVVQHFSLAANIFKKF